MAVLVLALGFVACGGGGDGGSGGSGGGGGEGGEGGEGGIEAVCGNEVVEPGEDCDDGNDANDDGCIECARSTCGDGFTMSKPPAGREDELEECDDGNDSNKDDCTSDCKLTVCGDGIVNDVSERAEECDDHNDVNDDECSNECKTAKNGDGIVNRPEEECDDGDDDDTDECPSSFKLAYCGDGFLYLNPPVGHEDRIEECDDGNENPNDGCVGCREAECGDGVTMSEPPDGVDAEECDDGNLVNEDACRNDCKSWVCGDGYYFPGFEGCDDGNLDDDDMCVGPNCSPARCGDGYVLTKPEGDAVAEGCDDGNHDLEDECPSGPQGSCQPASCGDGFVFLNPPAGREAEREDCDDGDDIEENSCFADCKPNTCGDGILNRSTNGREECDDANANQNDGCHNCSIRPVALPAVGQSVQLKGSLEAGQFGDPVYFRPDETCQMDFAAQYPYDHWMFKNESATDFRLLRVEAKWAGDGFLTLYRGELDPTDPRKGCDAPNDDLDGDPSRSGIPVFPVPPGETISIVATPANPDYGLGPYTIDVHVLSECGDGITDAFEGCDDGDTFDGNGCDGACQVEPGFTCVGTTCTNNVVCGDGNVGFGEACDDGNGTPDSCNATCTAPNAGWVCAKGVCHQVTCGDGILDSGEECDDGNTTSTDGCSATCAAEITDEEEPNDDAASANAFGGVGFYEGAIDPADDEDWWTFQASYGDQFVFETFAGSINGCTSNTVIEIYKELADGSTELVSSDDDAGLSACSKLGFDAPETATYHVVVRAESDTATISSYWLKATTPPQPWP